MSEFDEPLSATRVAQEQLHGPDLGSAERTLSLLGGSALLFNGLRDGGAAGLVQAGLGALLAWRGASGRCRVKRALNPTPWESRLQQQYGWSNIEALSRSVTIAKPRSEVYACLAEPARLAPVLAGVEAIETLEDGRLRWTFGAPLGKTFQVISRLEDSRQDERLVWVTEETRWLPHRCTLTFGDAPHGRGTEIKAVLACEPPAGRAGYAAAALLGRVSGHALLRELRRLKQFLETGEVPSADLRARQPQDEDPDDAPGLNRERPDSAFVGEGAR
ncbi:cyclase/dehydrase [Pseudomonas sp. RIT-PI-AD]|uniref:SRPBCC family protein n=1 Tax=Pseudomonas sp. RIT-PI-AD TaxID=3035294 RepID=UPI0021DB7CE0|nr:cyclase/dehydrase [Pseudomonas sp. RIT-PI-AD]